MSDYIRDAFHSALHKRISEEVQTATESLASGAASSFDHYRYRVGYLSALRDVLRWAHETEKRIYDPPPRE